MINYESKQHINNYYNQLIDELHDFKIDDELIILHKLTIIESIIDKIKTDLFSILYYNAYGEIKMRESINKIRKMKSIMEDN